MSRVLSFHTSIFIESSLSWNANLARPCSCFFRTLDFGREVAYMQSLDSSCVERPFSLQASLYSINNLLDNRLCNHSVFCFLKMCCTILCKKRYEFCMKMFIILKNTFSRYVKKMVSRLTVGYLSLLHPYIDYIGKSCWA